MCLVMDAAEGRNKVSHSDFFFGRFRFFDSHSFSFPGEWQV